MSEKQLPPTGEFCEKYTTADALSVVSCKHLNMVTKHCKKYNVPLSLGYALNGAESKLLYKKSVLCVDVVIADKTKSKVCPGCGVLKDFSEYNRERSKPDGLQRICRVCTRAHYLRRRGEQVAIARPTYNMETL